MRRTTALMSGLILLASVTRCTEEQVFEIVGRGAANVYVTVTPAGNGDGQVKDQSDGVSIQCNIENGTAKSATEQCADTIYDAGGGGSIDLLALASGGSVFDGWTGACNSSAGLCTISYAQPLGDSIHLDVTATFRLAPGELHVLAQTSGTSLDPDGYTLQLTPPVGSPVTTPIGTNDEHLFADLAAGNYGVELQDIAINCAVGLEGNPRTLAVTAGMTTETTFQVTCNPPPDPWSVVYYSMVNDYRRVSFAISGTGMALATNGAIVRSVNRGVTWTEGTAIDHSTYGDGLGIAVPHADTAYVLAGGSTVLRSIAGGAWTVPGATMASGLTALYFPDGMNGWVVGSNGTILYTDDAGATWTPQTSNTAEALQAVSFFGTQFGAAVTSAGTIVSTTDGGATAWSATTVPGAALLRDVWLASASVAMVVGRTSTGLPMVIQTDDAGANWGTLTTNLPMSTAFIPVGVALPTPLVATLVGSESAGQVIYRSVDGGMTWAREQFTSPRLQQDVFMFDADEGVTAGAGVVLHRP